MTDKITHEHALEVFSYNPETGELTNRINVYGGGRGRKGITRVKGELAGTAQYIGSKAAKLTRVVSYNKVAYQEHRLIFFMVEGFWPTRMIRHIDGDRTNNTWDNLLYLTDDRLTKSALWQREHKQRRASA